MSGRLHTMLAVSGVWTVGVCGLLLAPHAADGQGRSGAVKVKITDEKPDVVELVLPVDPNPHATYQSQGNMSLVVRVDGKTMHLGQISTIFKIDEQVTIPRQIEKQNERLP